MGPLRTLLRCSAICALSQAAPPLDLFTSGSPVSINDYRIPALIRTARGTLLVVAEARTTDNDCAVKYLVARRSVDGGTTWSDITTVFGPANLTASQGAGNPVVLYDAVTSKVLLHFSINDPQHCSPSLVTLQVDDGGSDGLVWGQLKNLSSALGEWNGATPGPGTGAQIMAGPHAGRLIVPAHYGAYETDVTWWSDDHGDSWHLSTTLLPKLDEVVVVALPDGSLLLYARTNHLNSSCGCRAVTRWGASMAVPR